MWTGGKNGRRDRVRLTNLHGRPAATMPEGAGVAHLDAVELGASAGELLPAAADSLAARSSG